MELIKSRSSGNSNSFIRSYNMDHIMAFPTDLDPTDTANEELVNMSINHIAHGDTVSPNCC